MFEIDKKKFGAFVSEIRKEKGYTQKELALHCAGRTNLVMSFRCFVSHDYHRYEPYQRGSLAAH